MKTAVKERAAIVIGGGGGIGRAAALALAQDGIRVTVADMSLEAMAATCKAMADAGHDAVGLQVDVCDRQSVRDLVGAVVERFGRVDILVNSSGVFPMSRVADMETSEWDRVLDVNLRGSFLCYQAVLAPMRAQGHGRIVGIGSGRGTDGYLGGAHYAASKAGLIGLTKSLALETRTEGITVNVISPGMTDTAMVRSQFTPEQIDHFVKQHGTRLGQPEDVVGLLRYVVSEDAGHVTGQVFTLKFP